MNLLNSNLIQRKKGSLVMGKVFGSNDDVGLFKKLLMRAGRLAVGVDVKMEVKSDVAGRFKTFRKGQEVIICMRGTMVDLKESGAEGEKKNVIIVKATRLIAATPKQGGMILKPTQHTVAQVRGS